MIIEARLNTAICRGAGATPRGFSLVEVMVAIFMAGLVFLMLAQMIGVGIEANRVATDTTRTGALAADRMEELTRSSYADLVPGGDINADVAGFSETLDVDADGIDDYLRRWEIIDLGAEMRVRVRAIALLDVIGPAKEATYVALKADR